MLKHRMELRSKTKKMLCHVSLPDSTVFEVDFDSQSDGLEILNKVCEKLDIMEMDYFGLMHTSGKKAERLWLNLRNRFTSEVSGASQPCRLELRIKFFVPPHMIQQDITRHQFYLNICESFLSGHLHIHSDDQLAHMAALIAQVELGDMTANVDSAAIGQQYAQLLPANCDTNDDQLLAMVRTEHLRLSGTLESTAKYRLLQMAAELPSYGCCYHDAKMANGMSIHVAVGADGITLHTNDWSEIKTFSYTAIQKLTNDASNLLLEVANDDSTTTAYTLRLASRTLANALYRAMTEKYYFYHCDTVGRDVMAQYCRDLKGTLASLFNEHTELGKSYVFDIQHTMSESYDRIRRSLYASSVGSVCSPLSESDCNDSSCSSPARKQPRTQRDSVSTLSSTEQCSLCCSHCQCCQTLHETVQRYKDSLVCQLCYDNNIDTTLVPCGHTISCSSCAARLDLCPLCKVGIVQRLKIFLPSIQLPQSSPPTLVNDVFRQQASVSG